MSYQPSAFSFQLCAISYYSFGYNHTQELSMPNLLDLPLISRIRRNHGLEHATLTTLARRFPNQPMAGYSDLGGFWIIGNLDTEALADAVTEALERLRKGERSLAVHPSCGTNYATAGVLAGTAGALAMLGSGKRLRNKLERLPLAAALATLAIIIAQPLAMIIQSRVTTCGEPGRLALTQIMRQEQGKLILHRVHTKG
jgi:hypothetical protein